MWPAVDAFLPKAEGVIHGTSPLLLICEQDLASISRASEFLRP